jgi:hypothetical protein
MIWVIAKKNNLKQYLDRNYKQIDDLARMKLYYKKLKWVVSKNQMLKLPGRTVFTSHLERQEKSAEDIMKMKLFNITTF